MKRTDGPLFIERPVQQRSQGFDDISDIQVSNEESGKGRDR
jgi:hypothetical protein